MKTIIRKDGNNVVVSIGGQLDYEKTDSFKEYLARVTKDTPAAQVVFDLSELEFVGSSGISAFVQTLRDFNVRAANKPRYTNVKSEFKRIMSAFDESGSFDFGDAAKLKNLDN